MSQKAMLFASHENTAFALLGNRLAVQRDEPSTVKGGGKMGWLNSLFARRKLIYSTFNESEYMRVMNLLDGNGVPYVLRSNRSNQYTGSQWSNFGNTTEYKFYVKLEDEGRAIKAMNQR